MQAGFTALESGLVRSKSSINVAIKNFANFLVAASLFWVFGFGLMFGSDQGGLIGTSSFVYDDSGAFQTAFFLFQLGFIATATTLMSGAVAERMRFGGYLVLAIFVAAITYPVFGHWAWGGGWLEELGFVDFAGATVVHSVGGWVALAAIVILGPRIGRFGNGAVPIRADYLPLTTVGVFVLWVGWYGFNGGSRFGLDAGVPAVILNTTLAATFGGLVGTALTWRLDGRPDVVTIMNASLAGLVAITASAYMMSAWKAALIGGVGAVVMRLATHALERMRIDDAVGAVPVHLGAGLWGTLAVGLLGDPDAFPIASGNLEQTGIQLVGIAVACAWAFGVGYVVLALIDRRVPFRIDAQGELAGLNIAEHGASTAMVDLMSDMDEHRRTGDFDRPVHVEPHTEVGQIAAEYNRVLHAMRHRSDSLNLLRLTSAAANESSSVDEALALALDEVCAFTGWPVGHAYLVSRENPDELVSTGIWRIPDGADAPKGADHSLLRLALETRKPVQGSAGSAACLAVPIMAGSHAVGVMELIAEAPLPTDAELLDLLLSVGTQLGRVVERQRSEEARLRALVDNMPAHVYLRDLSGRYILVNRQYEEFWDLRLDDIRGRTLAETAPLTDVDVSPEVHARIDREVVATGRPSRHEANVLRHGKEHVIADVRFPVLDGSSRIVAVAGIDIDVTEQKRNEAELAELLRRVEMARDAATEAVAAKSRFLASMSHELRTPLNAIIGFTRLVSRNAGGLQPKQVDNLGKILSSAERLLALIDEILDLSRAESGKVRLEVAETDVGGVLREVADSLEPLVDRPRVRVIVEADPDLPPVATDREKVKHILLNLLSNAIKYTDDGSILMRAKAVDGRLRIAVSDTGIGIPRNELGKVFLEFHRADSAPARSRGGTGLGLAISQRFARALGGAITVDSRIGAGSTFTVDLPMRP